MLTLKIREQDIVVSNLQKFIKGTVGAKCKVIFDNFWTDYNKTIVFKPSNKFSGGPIAIHTRDMTPELTIPWEVMSKVGGFKIGVYGTTDKLTTPTLWCKEIDVVDGTDTTGKAPQEPTPNVYNQLIDMANEAVSIAQSVRDDADAGKFNGGPGEGLKNIMDSTGSAAIQQTQDTKYSHVAIKTKNPNAYMLDPTLTDAEPIGATGEFTSAFGGVSSAQGKRSASFGTNTVAKGKYSLACGDNSVTLGSGSFASGQNTVAKGSGSHSSGTNTQAIGNSATAEGAQTIAEGDASHAGGASSLAKGIHSFAHGNGVIADKDNQAVFGKFNEQTNALFAIGDGYDDDERSNAFEVFGGHGQTKYATLGGDVVITEPILKTTYKKTIDYIDNVTSRKTVSGEILNITGLTNKDTTVVDSTVTDNYFYKENFVKSDVVADVAQYAAVQIPQNILLTDSTGNNTPVEVTIGRNKFDDGLVKCQTAYIIFTTPNNTQGYNTLGIEWISDYTHVPIKALKSNHQYMLLIVFGASYDDGTQYRRYVSFPYLVDYEDSYHWVKGDNTDSIPLGDSIMIPHIGRIDKGDTLTVTYNSSDMYPYIEDKLGNIETLLGGI